MPRPARGGLLDLHPAEPPLEGGVLLDVGAELLVGGRADHLQLARASTGFKMLAASMAPSAAPAPTMVWNSSTNRMTPPVPHQFFQQAFEALLKVAAVLGAGHQAGHIQCQQPPAFEGSGHLPRRDALGQPLGQGGLAHAGLPHQAGVILLPPAEDLDHPVSSLSRQKTGSSSPVGGTAGQVPAIFVAGAAAPGRAGRRPWLRRQGQLSRHLAALPHGLAQLQPHRGQHHPRRAPAVLHHGAQQMFRFGPGLRAFWASIRA